MAAKKKLRLVKVVTQAYLVIDDGETLTEVGAQPIEVTAADWPEYPKRLERERVEQEKALQAE